jgi:hypothetical protein
VHTTGRRCQVSLCDALHLRRALVEPLELVARDQPREAPPGGGRPRGGSTQARLMLRGGQLLLHPGQHRCRERVKRVGCAHCACQAPAHTGTHGRRGRAQGAARTARRPVHRRGSALAQLQGRRRAPTRANISTKGKW